MDNCHLQDVLIMEESMWKGIISNMEVMLLVVMSSLKSWIIPCLLTFLACHLWSVWLLSCKDQGCQLPLPPGSMGLPLVGETLNLVMKGSDFFRERTKSYGSVYKTHILGKKLIRITGAKNVEIILKGEGTLVESRWPVSVRSIIGDGALCHSSGEEHNARRSAFMEAFDGETLEKFVPTIQEICKEYVRKWCDLGEIPGYVEARNLTFTIAARLLLGMDIQRKSQLPMLLMLEDMLASLFSLPVPLPGIGSYKGLKARRALVETLHECLDDLEPDGVSDDSSPSVLGRLMADAKQKGKPMSNSEIQDAAIEMLFAGHLPASSAVCSVLMMLGMHPKFADKVTVELIDNGLMNPRSTNDGNDLNVTVLNNLNYVDAVVKEVLRVAPPVGAGYREALQTFEIDGCQIPKGWTVVYSIRETHHTSDVCKKVEQFDPDRWCRQDSAPRMTQSVKDFHYVPFGHGARSCVGQKYVELVLKILIVELVRSSTWRLVNGPPKIKYMPVPHPADGLPLMFREMPVDLRRRAFTMAW